MKNITILGSTGSIGTQALEVINNKKNKFNLIGISANKNVSLLVEQAKLYKPKYVCIVDEDYKDILLSQLDSNKYKILFGISGLLELSQNNDANIMLNALVGYSGMEPTIRAIKAGINVALSNKESLVMAGAIINDLLNKNNVELYPVDSEHSAIWQCIRGERKEEINKIILTGSGGPFRKKDISNFKNITKEEALKHPNWSMGNKITIDSSTMMNKGLEVIEAYWLFNLHINQIEIIIHPESIVHSMVEFLDGSIKAQLGVPSMKVPIQYALTYPEHLELNHKKLDLIDIGVLNFEKPDLNKFKCIQLAYNAIKSGGSYPVVLNVANDILVSKFLNDKISYLDIPDGIEKVLDRHEFIKEVNLDNINFLIQWVHKYLEEELHD